MYKVCSQGQLYSAIYRRRHVQRGRLRRERDSAELIVEASVERGEAEHLLRIGFSAIRSVLSVLTIAIIRT